MPKGTRFTESQIKTMLKDSSGMTLKDAAVKFNVSVGALHKWRKQRATKTIKIKIEPKAKSKTNVVELIKTVKANISLIEKELRKCK